MSFLTVSEIKSMVDVVNELTNAVLLEICDPGPLQGNGDPGQPVTIWKGEAPGFLERARHEHSSSDRDARGIADSFRVFDAVAPAVEIAGSRSGASTVVIRDKTRAAAVTRRWTVNGTVKETEGTLDSIRLQLENEAAA